ncbi:MAG: MFS transporter [Caulobacteraceae bacterium]|nr:MFS transporter [Caulobacteraceae bacterium]
MTTPRRLSGLQLAAFSAPTVPMAALGLPLVVFLPEYYSNDLGLPLASVGLAFGLVRILDIGVDPVLGALMDRTNTRFGRFRPWVAAGAPVLMAAVYMLFMAQRGVGVAYLWFWLLIGYLGLSMSGLSHIAWAAKLNTSYDGRSRTYAWVQAFSVIGLMVVLLLPAALALLAHGGSMGGVHAMGWLTIVTIPLAFALALAAVGEPAVGASSPHANWRDYLALFRNRTVLRLLATDQALSLAPNITGALFFFYIEQVKGFTKGEAEALLFVYFIAGLVGAPLWLRLAYRLGKHRALALASVIYTVTQSLALFMPQANPYIAFPAMFLAGLPYSAAGLLVRSMLADVGDAERLATGADRTGLFYALSSANGKIAAAASVIFPFYALSLMGFKPATGAVNSHTALLGLQALFAVVPGLLGLVAAGIIRGYPLTAERHAAVREKLDLLAAERDLFTDTAGLLVREPHDRAAE